MTERLTRAAGGAVTAEVAFTRQETVDATVLVPFAHDGQVVFALPYAQRPLAEALAAAADVAVVLSDARLTLRGWEPLAVIGRCRLEPDPEGKLFVGELLDQELRKHPPARLLVDSLMKQRENWWYLPRLVVRLAEVRAVRPVGPRHAADEGVLAWLEPAGLEVDTVAVDRWEHDLVPVRSLARPPVRGGVAPSCLVRHDYSTDMEQRCELVLLGQLRGADFHVHERRGHAELPGRAGLVERFRAARAFERACRRELARPQ